MERKDTIFNTFTFILTLGCFIFVIYQGRECVIKYINKPKSTDVTIEHASKNPYPSLTLCPKTKRGDENALELTKNTLKKCNLTLEDLQSGKWFGVGNESYCEDPKELYNMIMGTTDLIEYSTIMVRSKDGKALDYELITRHDFGLGVNCVTLSINSTDLFKVMIYTFVNATIKIGTPGDFYGDSETTNIILDNGVSKGVKIKHELFEVLDFDGEECVHYGENSRDDCIMKKIHDESINQFGCTFLFDANKSTICTDPENGVEATNLYRNVLMRSTGLTSPDNAGEHVNQMIKDCKKSCQYLMTTCEISERTREILINTGGTFYLEFRQFIKVSRTRWDYGGLELLAEVGGYVGLFLGVSINQLAILIQAFFQFFNYLHHKYYTNF